jgi:hypothetical protein
MFSPLNREFVRQVIESTKLTDDLITLSKQVLWSMPGGTLFMTVAPNNITLQPFPLLKSIEMFETMFLQAIMLQPEPVCTSLDPLHQAYHRLCFMILGPLLRLQQLMEDSDTRLVRGLSLTVTTDMPQDRYQYDKVKTIHLTPDLMTFLATQLKVPETAEFREGLLNPAVQSLVHQYLVLCRRMMPVHSTRKMILRHLELHTQRLTLLAAQPVLYAPVTGQAQRLRSLQGIMRGYIKALVLLFYQCLSVCPKDHVCSLWPLGMRALAWMDLHINEFDMYSSLLVQTRRMIQDLDPETYRMHSISADCVYELRQLQYIPRMDVLMGLHRMVYLISQDQLDSLIQYLVQLMDRMTQTASMWMNRAVVIKFASVLHSLSVLMYRVLYNGQCSVAISMIPRLIQCILRAEALRREYHPLVDSLIFGMTLSLMLFPEVSHRFLGSIFRDQVVNDCIQALGYTHIYHLDANYLIRLAEPDLTWCVASRSEPVQFHLHRAMVYPETQERASTTMTLHYELTDIQCAVDLMYSDKPMTLSSVQLMTMTDLAIQLQSARLMSLVVSRLLQPGQITKHNIDQIWNKALMIQSQHPIVSNLLLHHCVHYSLCFMSHETVATSICSLQSTMVLDAISRGHFAVPVQL